MSLTPKQVRFVEEYLIDLNATAAAKRAGYSKRTAYAQGQRLLKNVEIAAAIQKAQKARSERTKIDQDWVIERLVGVYEASMEARPVCDKNGEEKGFTFNPTAAYAGEAAVVKSHGGERCGNVGTMIPTSTVERGERKRTTAEVSTGAGL
jgi:phage terminase small subunit